MGIWKVWTKIRITLKLIGSGYFVKALRLRGLIAFHGIDLGEISMKELGLDPRISYRHGNSSGPTLTAFLASLPITANDKVLDLGCGAGGAMLTMALFPFGEIDGLEINIQLAATAQHNLATLHVQNATIYCGNAAEWHDLDKYTYIYMCNPFPEVVMESVAQNLRKSLNRVPRPLQIIYTLPKHGDALERNGFRCQRRDCKGAAVICLYDLDDSQTQEQAHAPNKATPPRKYGAAAN